MSEKDILPSLLSSLLENRLKELEKKSDLEMKTLSMLEGYSKTIQTNIPIYFTAIDKYIEKKKKEEEEKKKKEADKKNHKRSQSQGNNLKTPQRSMQRNKTEGSLKTKPNKDKVLTKNKSVGNMMRSADQMSKTITKSSGKNLKPLNLTTSNAKPDKTKTPAQTVPNKDNKTSSSSKGSRQRGKSESNKKSKSTGKDLKPKANTKETKEDKKKISKKEETHKEDNKDKGNENKNDTKENETSVTNTENNTNTVPPPETEKPKEEVSTENKSDTQQTQNTETKKEENTPVTKEENNPPKEEELPINENNAKEEKPPTITTTAPPEVTAPPKEELPVKEEKPIPKEEVKKVIEVPKVNKIKLLSTEKVYRKMLQLLGEKEQMPFIFISRRNLQIFLQDKLPALKEEMNIFEKVMLIFIYNIIYIFIIE